MVNIEADLEFDDAITLNEKLCRPLEATKDYKEGIRAFFEKRPAMLFGQ